MSEEYTLSNLNIDLRSSPTAFKFLQDKSFVTGLMGPVGCVAPETQVITEFGPMPIWKIDRPMRVLSWNDQTGQFQLSWCGGSFPKGTDYLLRVLTPQGEFAASEHHLLFDADHNYRRLDSYQSGDEVLAVSDGLEATSLLSDLKSSPQDGLHLTKIAVDSLASYAESARQYGQQLLMAEGIDLAFVPSHDDAHTSALFDEKCAAERMDGFVVQLSKRIHQGLSCVLKQIDGFLSHSLHLQPALSGSGFSGYGIHTDEKDQLSWQSRLMSAFHRKVQSLAGASFRSSSVSNRSIISIKRETVKRSYWDMQVLDTHNYVTVDGTIHHNSGKSFVCAAKVMIRAVQQAPSPADGIRYSRFVIVRNSYPELKTTTLKTWGDLFPENIYGPILHTPPITHHIKLPPRGDAAGIDCEVIFLALDQPKDVRKLLSLELTGAWVNEAKELPKAVIDGLTHRVGRYPTKRDGGATWHGIWMDTNPMDDDHWWFRLAEKEPIGGRYAWKFFKQPGGIIEVPSDQLPEMPEANDHVFSCGKWWKINPKAENIKNLPPGYYLQQLAGKNLDWIRCYAKGEYTYVQEGKPVWPEYDDNIMSAEVEPDPNLPIQVGLDFGLTPAAVFGQRHPNGQWRVLHEVVTFDMGLERFGSALMAELHLRFPKYDIRVWGDPAGLQRDAIYETTAFEFLRSLGLKAEPAPTNDFKARREAAAGPMGRMVMGKPGLLVNKSCKLLRKSLSGGYHFKRVAVGAGHERFKDTPNKNEHSHVGDAFGYLMSGGGEYRQLTRGSNRTVSKTFIAQTVATDDFEIFA